MRTKKYKQDCHYTSRNYQYYKGVNIFTFAHENSHKTTIVQQTETIKLQEMCKDVKLVKSVITMTWYSIVINCFCHMLQLAVYYN